MLEFLIRGYDRGIKVTLQPPRPPRFRAIDRCNFLLIFALPSPPRPGTDPAGGRDPGPPPSWGEKGLGWARCVAGLGPCCSVLRASVRRGLLALQSPSCASPHCPRAAGVYFPFSIAATLIPIPGPLPAQKGHHQRVPRGWWHGHGTAGGAEGHPGTGARAGGGLSVLLRHPPAGARRRCFCFPSKQALLPRWFQLAYLLFVLKLIKSQRTRGCSIKQNGMLKMCAPRGETEARMPPCPARGLGTLP